MQSKEGDDLSCLTIELVDQNDVIHTDGEHKVAIHIEGGIHTYQKIVSALGMEIVIRNEEDTVKGSCIAKAQEILMNSTETQAIFMTCVMEAMAKYIGTVIH